MVQDRHTICNGRWEHHCDDREVFCFVHHWFSRAFFDLAVEDFLVGRFENRDNLVVHEVKWLLTSELEMRSSQVDGFTVAAAELIVLS